MERCANCGQLSRLGARFCTTCGNKLTGEEVAQSADAGETAQVPAAQGQVIDPPPPTSSEGQVSGWPAAPAASESVADVIWAPANGASATPSEATDEAVNGEAWPSTWSTEVPSWPAPPTAPEPSLDTSEETTDVIAVRAEQEPDAGTAAQEIEIEITEQELDEGVVERVAAQEQSAQSRERAAQLLDELREVIITLGGAAPRDLSGVISELEVAVTPPGAIGTEELSELRDALLKARERPRDLDTIVDLTGRIDALVALVIAYDRTIAAIERSLDVLRGDG